METYRNLNGNSGVKKYEIGRGFVKVEFDDEKYIYTYTKESAGPENLARMKELAEQGYGLATFINRFVHGRFAAKTPL